ncbi:MFS transporter [Ktedonosporobacter rubrisoli]|uniref:MFS transporter n=1 Tax=Ktedonosporobacter rubrisoli TaxID=2509675 RepID=A0A4V0YY09_KTERU|nr:MFS transporter [Ktedonosporobacter rubrisoli]QBD74581.1 MFS transporter [Ktedonosporobacter rubrisoli]
MLKSLTDDHLRFARALQSRPFALLWAGQTVSRLGDFAFNTALAWQVLLLTGSGAAMGTVLIASNIPQLIFLLIGGIAADRLPRLLILLCSDIGRALAVLLIALLGWLHLLQLWHLIGLSLLFGVASGFFFPTYQALPAQLVEREMLNSANTLNSTSKQIGILLGPLLGASFVAMVGPALAFAFDGASFAISALCIILIGPISSKVPQLESQEADKTLPAGKFHKLLYDIREGLGYVLSSSWLWVTILIASVANIALSGPLQVALPKLVMYAFKSGIWLLGTIGTFESLGALIGTILIGQASHLRSRGLIAYLAFLLSGFGLLILGLPFASLNPLIFAIAASLLIGFGTNVFNIIWTCVLQELVPPDKQGRVFSIDALGSLGFMTIGFALAGMATDTLGPSWVFLIGGLLQIALILIGLCVPGIRKLE